MYVSYGNAGQLVGGYHWFSQVPFHSQRPVWGRAAGELSHVDIILRKNKMTTFIMYLLLIKKPHFTIFVEMPDTPGK